MRSILLACFMAIVSSSFAKGKLDTSPGKPKEFLFVQNNGQITDQNSNPRTDIDFKASGNGVNIFVGDGQIHYQFSKVEGAERLRNSGKGVNESLPSADDIKVSMYRMDVMLVGANTNAQLVQEDMQEYYEAYYLPGVSGANAQSFRKITYKDVYPNIDWVIFSKDGKMKYEFVVRAGGNPADIKLKFTGASKLNLEKNGGLTAATPMGSISEDAPYSYSAETKRSVASSFKLTDDVLSFNLENYEGTLVIDPSVAWSTYYGDVDVDYLRAVTTDASGNVYTVGYTNSTSNIATVGAHLTTGGGASFDGLIVKFNSSGTRLWATYYGGTGNDFLYGVAPDASGNIYVCGATGSTTGIATNSTTFSSGIDVFAAKFNSGGIRQWGTYAGGTGTDAAFGLVVDGSSNIYISGYTSSTSGIATSGTQQFTHGGGFAPTPLDGYLMKFNGSTGAKTWGTYYGGTGDDALIDIAGDASGNIYATGWTASSTGIASGGHQNTLGGMYDALVVKFTSGGLRTWGSYYGGNNLDDAFTIDVDASANVIIGGEAHSTGSIASPTGAMQGSIASVQDGFIAKFNTSGTRQWGTYFGGFSDTDMIQAVAVDPSGNIYVSGYTYDGTWFPMLNQDQNFFAAGQSEDGFVAKLNSAGALQWSSAFGGADGDVVYGMAVNGQYVYLAGATASTANIASATNSFQSTFSGQVDGFLAKIDTTTAPTVCNCAYGGSFYPTTVLTPMSYWQTAANDIYPGEYSMYNVDNGYTYEWSYCPGDGGGANYDTKLNLFDALSQTYLACNDDYCGLTSKLTWTANFTGQVRLLTSKWTATDACAVATSTADQGQLRYRSTLTCTVPAWPGSISGNTTVCAGSTQTYTVAPVAGATFYTWAVPSTWSGGTVSGNSITLTAGTVGVTITAYAHNACGASPPVTLTITVNSSGTATITPAGPTTLCTGGSVLLNANTGTGLTYQWKLNGNNITNATNSSYNASAAGNYTVVVSAGASCSATSSVVTVTTGTPPAASISPAGPISICSPNQATLTASPSGAGYTYQWNYAGNPISGETNSTYTTAASGSYSVTVSSGSNCSATSSPVTLTVGNTPSGLVAAQGPTTFCAGGSVVLEVINGGGIGIQWKLNGVNIPAAGGNTYTATASGTYSVQLTDLNSGCSTTVGNAVVTVVSSPTASATAQGPTTFCTGSSVVLSAMTGAGYQYQWYNGANVITGATNANYTATTSGSYTVNVNTGSACNAISTAIVVTVNAAPSVAVNASGPLVFCTGGSVTLSVPSATGVIYQWYNGVSAISGATNNAYTANASGSYTVTATGAGSCSATSTPSVVTVNTTPAATISASGVTTFCAGGSVTLNANTGTGYTYQWYNGVNAISGATNASYFVSSGGSYSVVVSAGAGCSATSTATAVTVNTTPSVSVNASGPLVFCTGGSVTFSVPNAAGVTYQWYNGVSAISGATNNSYSANTSGSYTVTATGSGSCSATSTPSAVTVNTTPTATITASGATTFCTGGSVTLNANTGTGYTYQWYNGANAVSGATNSSYTTSTSGSYTVVVTAGASCSATSAATTVTVNQTPSVGVSASGGLTFCSGGSVTLSVPSAAGVAYQWYNGVSAIGGATNNSYTATTSGSYTVTATGAGSCSATSTASVVTVTTTPTATISATGATTFCSGGSVTLNATTGAGYTYQWYNGATAITGATNSSYQTTISGSYSVAITAGGSCSATSTAVTVTVNPAPTATATASGPTTFCTGGNVVLNANTGTGLTHKWQLNGVDIPGAISSSYTATTAGSYTVMVTNAGNCSTTSSAITVVINTTPSATITPAGPTTFCTGGNVLLNANTGIGLSYQWKLNGVDIAGANGTGYTATASGSYTVEVTSGTCAALSSPMSVTVTPGPANLTASSNSPVCAGSAINFTATSTSAGVNYSWAGPVSFSATGATPSIATASAANAGTYTVTATVNGCSATATTTVVVSSGAPSQPGAISGSTNICASGTQVYSIGSVTGATSYTWTLPTGWTGTSTTNSITVTPNGTSGAITVSANNGCGSSAVQTINITVSPIPLATVTPAGVTIICNGEDVTLDANTGAGLTYQWQSNGGNISGATNASYTTTLAGGYTVIVSNGTCSATSSVATVAVNSVPTASFSAIGATTFCAGGNVTFTAGVPIGFAYQWLNGGTVISGATNPTYTTTASGTYSLVVFNSNLCTDTSATIVVTVNPLPTVSISQAGNVLSTTGTYATYQWYLNGTAITGATNANYTPTQSGQYYLEVSNASNCFAQSNTITLTVGVRNITMWSDIKLYPNPNAGYFTIGGKVDAKDGLATLQVIDVTGKVQHSEEVVIKGGRINRQISLRDLAAGLYMTKLIAAEGVVSVPFMKE